MLPEPVARILHRTKRLANGCLVYRGAVSGSGYPKIQIGGHGGKQPSTHRVIFDYFKGPIPPGHHVCHSCNNKRCVEIDHLYAGTPKQNSEQASRDYLWGFPRGKRSKVEDL